MEIWACSNTAGRKVDGVGATLCSSECKALVSLFILMMMLR